MELLFRKYFWAVNLAFLALAAFFVARTANTFVGAAIGPAPSAASTDSKEKGPPPMKMVGTSVLNPEATARLFGIELPKAEAVVATERPLTPEELAAQAPVKTSLRASLIGTMVANRPQWSFATLRDDGSHDVGVYMVGDKFLNAEILEIDRLRVILLNENRKEYLALHDDAEAPPPPAPVASAPSTPSTPPADGEGVNKIDENNYEIARSKIDEQLSNLNNIATQARIVPSFKDGVANGFKLFSIRPGSLYSQIGIQNGDVIRRINGYEINSPDKALEVYSKLKESSKIEIELERRGTPLKKTYSIR